MSEPPQIQIDRYSGRRGDVYRATHKPTGLTASASTCDEATDRLNQLMAKQEALDSMGRAVDQSTPEGRAVAAVLGLHRPNSDQVCSECGDQDNYYRSVAWPCPTVQAVATQLGVELP